MKLLIFTLVLGFMPLAVGAQTCRGDVIPRPASVVCSDGVFSLNKNTQIVAVDENGRKAAQALNDQMRRNNGFTLRVRSKTPQRNYVAFLPPSSAFQDVTRVAGSYAMRVEPNRIRIEGSEAGHFYGVQTLSQMLPISKDDKIKIPAATIIDRPRFKYRGMHLDVARHFMPVSFVKKFIDLISQYKFNSFHWHLTDDQGWRIEVKKYPRLTEIGSKRPETMKDKNFSPFLGDGTLHEGFYTQEQIEDVVKYAKERHVTVIPEIELPGHASAALAAYPQFGCKPDYKYRVQTTWGTFKEVFCPTDETFKFLEDVLEETISLFPDSPYIHIGGDEVLKDLWKESAFVQELKKREGLKDENEVQSYFVRRIEKFINSKGRKMIGWDEILEGGLAPNATVMSWRGMRGGIAAAKSKHDVIMTPTDFAYLDYGQGDPNYEPINIGNHLSLEKVYSFEPIPKELSAEESAYVIGAQGNIWTEHMKTPDKVEYMALPRMLALAEVVWSRPEDKNFADFSRRIATQYPRLDKQNINYRIAEPEGLQNTVTANEKVSVTLRPAEGTRVHYTTDGSAPNERSAVYESPVEIALAQGETAIFKTVVVNAAGRKSGIYAGTIMRDKMAEPLAPSGELKAGVTYEITARGKTTAGDANRKSSESRSIQLTQFAPLYDMQQPYDVKFNGLFSAPEDGIYEFQIETTGRTKVSVAKRSAEADGAGTMTTFSLLVPLRKGLHPFSLQQNHRGGDATLNLRTAIKGVGLRRVYGGELFH